MKSKTTICPYCMVLCYYNDVNTDCAGLPGMGRKLNPNLAALLSSLVLRSKLSVAYSRIRSPYTTYPRLLSRERSLTLARLETTLSCVSGSSPNITCRLSRLISSIRVWDRMQEVSVRLRFSPSLAAILHTLDLLIPKSRAICVNDL